MLKYSDGSHLALYTQATKDSKTQQVEIIQFNRLWLDFLIELLS